MAELTPSSRRNRGKGAESAARSEALERLKALRSSGGRRSDSAAFQIKMDQPIYDTVAEEDYAALVARRREDVRGFIVDDDGLGYADEGEEEDWSHGSYSSAEEASRSEEEKPKKKAAKKDPQPKKAPPSSLSAAAALMGKQRLSSMFTSSVFKKSDRAKGSGVSADSIVDDVIAEFAPNETDRRLRRRRGSATTTPIQAARSFTAPSVQMKNEQHPAPLDVASNGVSEGGYVENGDSGHAESEPMDGVEENVLDSTVEADDTGVMDTKMSEELEEVKADVGKSEKLFSLNAKISKAEDDLTASATAGWKDVCVNDGNMGSAGDAVESNGAIDEKSEFVLDSDGSLPFYIIDAYEESFGSNMGTIYLFGKVKVGSAYQSCCVVVRNVQRCMYAFPRSSVFQSNRMADIEKKLSDSHISATEFRTTLQEMTSELKTEITKRLLDLNVSSFSMMPVKRGYAFERPDIPIGEHYVLKINYPFKDPPLPSDLKGEHFFALLGTHTSALELFLVKKKIKGPSWLSISKFTHCPPSQRVSWCKFEITVDCPKDLSVSNSKTLLDNPPVIVAALNLKTIISEKYNVNEIVSASIVCCHKTKIDSPMMASEWKRKGLLSHFTVVRKLDGGIFPMGLSKEVTERNSKAGSNILGLESSERALLNRLMIELHKLDCDVLVGHNISGFDLDVLLHRAQACKIPSSMWSKIGRLKRSVMPKLTKGNTLYGSGASPGIMSCIAGRLLCDTYVCARDLLKEVSYSLTQLAKTQLKKGRREVAPHDIRAMFETSATLLELVEFGETDAWLSLELMFHLSVLPLTRQLTNISGNLWSKTLQGARAQRVEYLLLHAFHAKKYIVPDKMTARNKEMTSKRRMNASREGDDADDVNVNDNALENAGQYTDQGKGKKGSSYSGGLVLEPKKGLYDKYILLLDFNSLYPSIIQEYNICFTTIERSPDGLVPNLPSSKTAGILPELLRNLIERRRLVKKWLKNAKGLQIQQFDIQQQALKLTANSMYGCLGFSNSRFYAKPLAEMITLQGREILQSTVDLVQNNLNLEVIYGDTDSIMIYSGLDDMSKAKALAGKVILEVNKKYRRLEIDLDGMYKRMLLLKKKKYAAVKVNLLKDGTPCEVIERKGLDMVRRDWSLLSKEIGDFCLDQILSGGTCEDVVESIHDSLMKVQEKMRKGDIVLEKYVITKTLTKPPEDYPDGKNQPHVQVALRLKQNGYTGCSAGDTVPYIICCLQDSGSGSLGIAQRARHLDELKKENSGWMIDIEYYLSQQIHPVVSRLCAFIEGTSPARLADCLGLDSSKFQIKTTSESLSKDPSNILLSVIDDEERYHGCEPLQLSCPSCSSTFDCPSVSTLISPPSNSSVTQSEAVPQRNFWHKMRCPRCPDSIESSIISPATLANQVKRQAENYISLYYKGLMMCDDEVCKYTTRNLNLRVIGDSERGTVCPNYPRCNGHLIRQYTEADLYKQLSYFCYVLDVSRCISKLEQNKKLTLEEDLEKLNQVVDSAASIVKKIRDRCAFGWVHMKDLCVSV